MKLDVLAPAVAAAALLMVATSPVLAQDGDPISTWPERAYNPKPDPDDVILPLPCDGAIVFRRVVTGSSPSASDTAPLDDKRVSLGTDRGDGRGYIEFWRTDYVAGPFADDAGRYYLLGKYEVTTAQFQAVFAENGTCPDVSGYEALMPASAISWFDAIDFTRRYTNWLYESGKDHLPKSLGGPSFVRLPTEPEWEFAARGGLAVADAERESDIFPLDGMPLSNFAWLASPQTGNELQPIGAKRPNPIGLHDILGNVEEIVLEPFRMNKVGRLHGQFGGMVARGGSIRSEEGFVSLATREEYPLFTHDDRGEVRRQTVGLRILVGASATGDFTNAGLLEDAFAAAQQNPDNGAGPGASQQLQEIRLREQDERLATELAAISAQLASETARRIEAEERNAKTMLMSAVVLLNELDKTALGVRVFDGESEDDPDPDAAAHWRRLADEHVAQFRTAGQVYSDIVKQLGEDLAPRFPSAEATLRAELQLRGQRDTFGILLDRVTPHVEGHQNGTRRDSRAILRSIAGEGRWLN